MLVKDCMTRHPIMIAPETLANEAQQIMTTNRVRHLPVVGDGKRLKGLVTAKSFALKSDSISSLNVWEISRRLANLRVKDVMVKKIDILTASANMTVERAAVMLNEARQSALVVLENPDIVVGILTEVDIMNALQLMLGLPTEGIRVTIRMPNRKGEFQKINDFLNDKDWCVMGIGTYPSPRVEGDFYDMVLKLPDTTIEEVREGLGKIEDHQIIDIRDVV
ncbi:MAG: CBS domain-containing protein [Ardenticatenaceae bacterium]|nr:CBS domain-containing protein [Ardenticatenaceae bacterium]